MDRRTFVRRIQHTKLDIVTAASAKGMKRMVAKAITDILEKRRWQVHEVKASDVEHELVDIDKQGLLKCVDGRASDMTGSAMHGPKMLGGIYAIASMRNVKDASGLADIVKEVEDHGFVPSVHGDGHAKPDSMGCGYFKLWKLGNLGGLPPPEFTSEEGKEAAIAAGAVYEKLKGNHYESQVVINLVENKTLVPNPHDQRFIVDGWVLGAFNLDAVKYVELAASTVEQLSWTCRSARLIVPG